LKQTLVNRKKITPHFNFFLQKYFYNAGVKLRNKETKNYQLKLKIKEQAGLYIINLEALSQIKI
jgi:hypothetical protein